MVSNIAAPKNTGGGGFVFEDDVCAWLLAYMLASEPAFGYSLGIPIRLDFQTRPDGWFLDDVLVTTATGTTNHRVALSIKSNAQFTTSSAPKDFVACAWEQWLHLGSQVFNHASDFMGLITCSLSDAARISVNSLIEKAYAGDPDLLPSRLATPNWASDEERRLFASFACPPNLASAHNITEADTGRLLQRLLFRQHDFGERMSDSLNVSLRVCRATLRSKGQADAEHLWKALRDISAELRPKAGSITRSALVDRLRTLFVLADYPDHAADWDKLDRQSTATVIQVPNVIARRIRLQRDASLAAVREATAANRAVVLVGASGVGKSAIARAFYEARVTNGERTLWFDARSFERPDFTSFEADLRLGTPLAELLSTTPGPNPVLILDGLDRLYSEPAFRIVAMLLRIVSEGTPATQWHLVIPCQGQEWSRVLESIQRAGFSGNAWKQVEIPRLSAQELSPVGTSMPGLARLFLLPHVANLLSNLKMLDLVARRVDAGEVVDSSAWVGESSIAEWFWTAEVDRGADRIARGSFARRLGQLQADLLLASVPVESFGIAELAPLETLAADRICLQVPGDRLTFAHDLYGDWARLRILLNHRTDLPDFLRSRRESPLWHRAVRLLAIHLLEQPSGVQEWRNMLVSFGPTEFGIIHDLLLEAPVFAANPRPLLEAILPDLLANHGGLLRRLLTRFLAFATVPNIAMVSTAHALGLDENTARATYRSPYWPYWLDVLRLLHTHQAEVIAVAPCEVARVVEMWMQFAPPGSILREEVAELGIRLGRYALETRKDYGNREWQNERRRFYTCALIAAPERADEATKIALTACERTTTTEAPPSLTSPNNSPSARRRRVRSFSRPLRRTALWPDGPHSRIDDEFQAVVLDSGAILELFRVRPDTAIEIVLASLIKPPREEDWDDDWFHRAELGSVDWHHWHPALYTHGPFLAFLRINFEKGLELIVRLVEFAISRWYEYAEEGALEWRTQALAKGESEAQVEEAVRVHHPQGVVMKVGNDAHTFAGDAQVYGWSAGLGNPPSAVEASLMALEQYFYLQLDEGKDIMTEIATVLARAKSVALLKVLCEVGKRHQVLFEGPLQPLLSAPELYEWNISEIIQNRSHMLIGAFTHGHWFVELAKKFHHMEHRKRDLRNIAVLLMLNRPAMREYFATVRADWEATRSSNAGDQSSPMMDQLIITLDPANYAVQEDPEHGTVLVNVKALQLQEKQTEELRATNEHMLIMSFPIQCRTILDENKLLSNEVLETMWEQWERICELAGQRVVPSIEGEHVGGESASAVSGGIAVFLRYPEWCESEPSRKERLLSALRALLNDPPQPSTTDSPESGLTWNWDCFVAEAVALLWGQEPRNVEWRQAVTRMVFLPRYATVKVLFTCCAEHRVSLGKDFSRLRRLALEWAYVRGRMDLLHRVPRESVESEDAGTQRIHKVLAEWKEERIAAFVSGSMDVMPVNWADCDDPQRFAELDAALPEWRRSMTMDFHLVRSAHEWLPLLDKAVDDRERGECIQFWCSTLSNVLARPIAEAGQSDHQYPSEDERWVLNAVAAVVLQLRTEETSVIPWQTLLDLGREAHFWPHLFAQALHRYALTLEQTPVSYTEIVRQMVQGAFTRVDEKSRWPAFEGVWDSLIGVDWSATTLWEPRHAALVVSLKDVFDVWMDKVPIHGRRLASFATWLARPAASSMRLRSLVWFLNRLRVEPKKEIRDLNEAADAVATLLSIIWTEDQQRLRSEPQAFETFRGLLGWLGDRQNSRGLELLGRIGKLA
jgi:hypothetical protein